MPNTNTNASNYLCQHFLELLQSLHELFYTNDSHKMTTNQKFEQQIYWRLAKLMEESGELAETIHAYFNHQRKSKNKDGKLGSKEHIAEELVDIIIVVALFAPMFGIDINKALEKKFKKIRKRMLEKYGVDILNNTSNNF